MNSLNTHERLAKRNGDIAPPSVRSFGITFAVVFALIALFPLLHGKPIKYWSFGLSAIFLALINLAPSVLKPLNLLWFKFGLLLHRFVNPVVLGAMFFVVITPMALVMRGFGKKFLNLSYQPDADTYWINRVPPGPKADSVRRQF